MDKQPTLLETDLKHRDGKKWKNRYCAVRKQSPVADRLDLYMYRSCVDTTRSSGSGSKCTIPLQHYYGVYTDLQQCDKEHHVVCVVCQPQVTVLAFDNDRVKDTFTQVIRGNMGTDHQFPAKLAKVPTHSKLPLGAVVLFIRGGDVCLTSGEPPKVISYWKVTELRKFGIVDQRKLCLEAGSCSGKYAGLYVLLTQDRDGADIIRLLRTASQGTHTGKPRRSYSTRSHNQRTGTSSSTARSLRSSPSAPFLSEYNEPRDRRGIPDGADQAEGSPTPDHQHHEEDEYEMQPRYRRHTMMVDHSTSTDSISAPDAGIFLFATPSVRGAGSMFRRRPHDYHEIDECGAIQFRNNRSAKTMSILDDRTKCEELIARMIALGVKSHEYTEIEDVIRSKSTDCLEDYGKADKCNQTDGLLATVPPLSMEKGNKSLPNAGIGKASQQCQQERNSRNSMTSSTSGTFSNVLSAMNKLIGIKSSPGSSSARRSRSLSKSENDCHTLPRMSRRTRRHKSGAFERSGNRPSRTSSTRNSRDLLNDVEMLYTSVGNTPCDKDLSSVRGSDSSISASSCGSTDGAPALPQSPVAVPSSAVGGSTSTVWDTDNKHGSSQVQRGAANKTIHYTTIIPATKIHSEDTSADNITQEPPLPPKSSIATLPTASRQQAPRPPATTHVTPNDSFHNLNQALTYVDFSQYDGNSDDDIQTMELPPVLPKKRSTSLRCCSFQKDPSGAGAHDSSNACKMMSKGYDCSEFQSSNVASELKGQNKSCDDLLEVSKEFVKPSRAKRRSYCDRSANSGSLSRVNIIQDVGSRLAHNFCKQEADGAMDDVWQRRVSSPLEPLENRTQNNNSPYVSRALQPQNMMESCPTRNTQEILQPEGDAVFSFLNLPMRQSLMENVPAPDMTSSVSSSSGYVSQKTDSLQRQSSFSSNHSDEKESYLDMSGTSGGGSRKSSADQLLETLPAPETTDLDETEAYVDMSAGKLSDKEQGNAYDADGKEESNTPDEKEQISNEGVTSVVEKPFDDLLDPLYNGSDLSLTDEGQRISRSNSMPATSKKQRFLSKFFSRNSSSKDLSSAGRATQSVEEPEGSVASDMLSPGYDSSDSCEFYSRPSSRFSSRRGSTDLLAVPEKQEEHEELFNSDDTLAYCGDGDSNLTDEQKQLSSSSLASRPSVHSSSSCSTPPAPVIPPRQQKSAPASSGTSTTSNQNCLCACLSCVNCDGKRHHQRAKNSKHDVYCSHGNRMTDECKIKHHKQLVPSPLYQTPPAPTQQQLTSLPAPARPSTQPPVLHAPGKDAPRASTVRVPPPPRPSNAITGTELPQPSAGTSAADGDPGLPPPIVPIRTPSRSTKPRWKRRTDLTVPIPKPEDFDSDESRISPLVRRTDLRSVCSTPSSPETRQPYHHHHYHHYHHHHHHQLQPAGAPASQGGAGATSASGGAGALLDNHAHQPYAVLQHPASSSSQQQQTHVSNGASLQRHASLHSNASTTSSQSNAASAAAAAAAAAAASPANTTLRPRNGKEYVLPDRKKLAEDLNLAAHQQHPGITCTMSHVCCSAACNVPHVCCADACTRSPSSINSVFTFEDLGANNSLSRMSLSNNSESSPRSPSCMSYGCYSNASTASSRTRDPMHDYVNVMASSASSRFGIDATPPASPLSIQGSYHGGPEVANPILNYAEIDLSQSSGSVGGATGVPGGAANSSLAGNDTSGRSYTPKATPSRAARTSDIEYAQVDVVATAACKRVACEHAQLREDSYNNKCKTESMSSADVWASRQHKNSAPAACKRLSNSRSASKDRKFSAPS